MASAAEPSIAAAAQCARRQRGAAIRCCEPQGATAALLQLEQRWLPPALRGAARGAALSSFGLLGGRARIGLRWPQLARFWRARSAVVGGARLNAADRTCVASPLARHRRSTTSCIRYCSVSMRPAACADAAELRLSLQQLLPVGTLGGVEAAAELLCQHRQRGGLVLIIGDFDADGATSTALLVRALRSWGFAAVDFLVPNRFEFGYGLTPEIVALAAQRQPALIVTVDNGISSNAGVAAARAAGIEVLITDHHLPAPSCRRPTSSSIPNVAGQRLRQPRTGRRRRGVLCARGAAPRCSSSAGCCRAARWRPRICWIWSRWAPWPTWCRSMSTTASWWRRGWRASAPGAACRASPRCWRWRGARSCRLVASDLGFAVAPRLNAAGRLTDMSIGIRCLLGRRCRSRRARWRRNSMRSTPSGARSRRRCRAEALLRPCGAARSGQRRRARAGVCLFDAGWHQGVVGLVASRVKERLRRPVIAFARADERHAARLGALDRRRPHPRRARCDRGARSAADPEVRRPCDGRRRDARGDAARPVRAPPSMPNAARALAARGSPDVIETDGELGARGAGAADGRRRCAQGGPWGPGFPEPLFDGVFRISAARRVGERHLKLGTRSARGPRRSSMRSRSIISTLTAQRARPLPSGAARLVYRLDSNEYLGERRLQFMIEHLLAA